MGRTYTEEQMAARRERKRLYDRARRGPVRDRAATVAAETARVLAERLAIIAGCNERGEDALAAAELMGMSASGMCRWASRTKATSSPEWKALDKVAMHQARTGRIGISKQEGYVSPQQRRAERIEDIEWMVSWGASDVEIARRTETSLRTLERYLYRNGRGDLWSAMTRYRSPNAWRESEDNNAGGPSLRDLRSGRVG